MITTRSQRWRDRRARYVDDLSVIDARAYAVDVIEMHQARRFVFDHHYLPNFPAARVAVGLFGPGAGGRPQLAGVAVFGVPTTGAVITAHAGMPQDRGCCLSRLVLLDSCAGNAESYFVSRSFRALRREKPDVETIVSHSDPLAGHIGQVFCALSGHYRGTTAPRTCYSIAGTPINGRTLSKIRLGERGAAGGVDQLVTLGAPRPTLGEPLDQWIDRLHRERILARSRRPGLHTYCFPLTRKARSRSRRLPRLAYPRITSLPNPQLVLEL